METMKYLNDETFDKQIAQGVTLVDFYADWCGPCRMMNPVIEELATEMEGKATVAKLDIENAQKTTSNYNVTSIPTIIIFQNGSEVDRIVGVRDFDSLKKSIVKFL